MGGKGPKSPEVSDLSCDVPKGIRQQQHLSRAILKSKSLSHIVFPLQWNSKKKKVQYINNTEGKEHQSESWKQRLPQRVYGVCINLSDSILPQHLK